MNWSRHRHCFFHTVSFTLLIGIEWTNRCSQTRQHDRERRRTTTIDRSALRPLPSTPSPYMPPISSPPRSPYRTVTPAQHQRVAGYPSRIPSRAREGHARSQSQGGNRASSAFFDSTDSIDQSRPSDGERGRG